MFPFDLPLATAFYLVVYVVTLVLHVLPMNYVLAGSTYLAVVEVAGIFGRGWASGPIAKGIRDWMPFALAVTITAGVAPLLFVQILYQRPFYTANLLLFHRWMSIVPVLIVAFYALYLQKSERFLSWPAAARAAVTLGTLACFAFVAWSWTENHLLSLRGEETWVATYTSANWFYHDAELYPRLLLWYVGAFPALAAVVAWQLRWSFPRTLPPTEVEAANKQLGRLSLATLAGSAAVGIYYAVWLPPEVRSQLLTWKTSPYLVGVVAGMLGQAAAWIIVLRRGSFAGIQAAVATGGLLVAVLGATALREARRIAAIDITAYTADHAQATQVGGLAVFLAFFVLNTLIIAGVVVLIRRETSSPRETK